MTNTINARDYMKNAMEEFQRDRNDVLGNFALSSDDIILADSILTSICSDTSVSSKVIENSKYDEYLMEETALTVGWYNGTAEEQINQRLMEGETDSDWILSKIARVNLILFRE